jgi:hypothetical protein
MIGPTYTTTSRVPEANAPKRVVIRHLCQSEFGKTVQQQLVWIPDNLAREHFGFQDAVEIGVLGL